jgi:putative nucleotidyltransferase with HDIG domain
MASPAPAAVKTGHGRFRSRIVVAQVTAAQERRSTYTAVPLEGLVGQAPLGFPLYLRTGPHGFVLYKERDTVLTGEQLGRLIAEGLQEFHIRVEDRQLYCRQVESALEDILLDIQQPLERRAAVLYGVAIGVAEELLAAAPEPAVIARAQRVMITTSGLVARDAQAFAAIRRVLGAGIGLAGHSLSVGFLAMGLARQVLHGDPNLLAQIGLAGLLHDIGEAGRTGSDVDPEHTRRGYLELRRLGLPEIVCEVALDHHERIDGSGFPRGLRGEEIPEFARIVGLVDTFEKVYAHQEPRVGVFDALRILAQAYRGCFDERLAHGLVQVFAA